jgi:hypothetical protein
MRGERSAPLIGGSVKGVTRPVSGDSTARPRGPDPSGNFVKTIDWPSGDQSIPSPLQSLHRVLIYHERDQVFDIKVIDLPQAYVGLHGRAILLISRPALAVLTAAELQALIAHELGHDFLWREFEQGRSGPARQALELECDGIAALTLVALGLDPTRLLAATRKMDQFNERFGTPSNVADYPTPAERQRFMKILLAGSHRKSTIHKSQPTINNQVNQHSAIRNQQFQHSPCRPLP